MNQQFGLGCSVDPTFNVDKLEAGVIIQMRTIVNCQFQPHHYDIATALAITTQCHKWHWWAPFPLW